ncbi:MAG: DUF1549 domain-containing protein [Burkholderiaceae bacterium]
MRRSTSPACRRRRRRLTRFCATPRRMPLAMLVDGLLASSAYGERWGRHWLDVARYADTAGDGADYPVREASQVSRLGRSMPSMPTSRSIDFIREQIAGDILATKGPPEQYASRVTATGFLAIGKRYGYKPSPDYQHLDFADAIDSVGRSLLGLSLGCARCHDHKFDPVSAADYYALYGIFQSTKWAFPGGEEQKRPSQFPPLIAPEEAARLDKVKAAELATARCGDWLDLKTATRRAGRPRLRAASISALEAQAIGKPPAAPWFSGGSEHGAGRGAESLRSRRIRAGTRGVRIGTGKANDGLRYVFASELRATPGRQMHFTIDFRTVAPADRERVPTASILGRGVVQSVAVEVQRHGHLKSPFAMARTGR